MASRRANFQLHGPTHARSITEAEKGDMNALSLSKKFTSGWFRRAASIHPSIHESIDPRLNNGAESVARHEHTITAVALCICICM
jgi:hypothetical protein